MQGSLLQPFMLDWFCPIGNWAIDYVKVCHFDSLDWLAIQNEYDVQKRCEGHAFTYQGFCSSDCYVDFFLRTFIFGWESCMRERSMLHSNILPMLTYIALTGLGFTPVTNMFLMVSIIKGFVGLEQMNKDPL
jgi:hypothetical protein